MYYNRLFIVLLVAILLNGCTGTGYPRIDFSQTAVTAVASDDTSLEQRPLRIALASVLSPQETIGNYRQIAAYISAKLGRPTVLIQRKTYQEVNQLLANGEVDLAFLSNGAYCAYRGLNEIEILAMAEHNGSTLYNAYVFAHKDSDIRTLEDLRGKVFAFTDPLSFSGHMVILSYLRQQKELPEKYFKRYIYTYSHDKSIWAVSNKIVDGASLDSMIYEYVKYKNPEIVANLRLVATIGPAPTGPVVINKNLNPDQKKQIAAIFLHMQEDAETNKAMQGLLIDRFILPKPEAYIPLRQLYDQMRGLE